MRSARTCAARATVLLALALLALALPAQGVAADAHQQTGSRHPKRGAKASHRKPRPTYWGAWIGSQITGNQPPWDMSAVSQFESLIGKGLSLLEFSSPFANCSASPCRFYDFPTQAMENVRQYGAIPFLSWGSEASPWVSSEPESNQPNIRLSDLAAGVYDSYLRRFADEARAWGHPFFLRFNWEMNGDWFPWSEQLNQNSPGQYIPAWQHVHDVFAAAGATNVTWVWCPYADYRHRFPDVAGYYPGSAYVDWTCLDGYNWGLNHANPIPWTSFSRIIGPSYRRIVRKVAPDKPMVLAELASSTAGGHKALWIRNMFKNMRTRYRRIRGLIWFNSLDRGIDWPLESSGTATAAFSKVVRQRAFQSNVYSALGTSPIPPPR
jgi:mannan endo-1,4-beta-mannosidase